MLQKIQELQAQILEKLPSLTTEAELLDYKNSIFGKNGELTVILKWLKDLSPEERSNVGKMANEIRDVVGEAFEAEKKLIMLESIER